MGWAITVDGGGGDRILTMELTDLVNLTGNIWKKKHYLQNLY
jgi:hypothetical protein